MKFVDLSGNSRMARLMDLTRELRGCQSPYEAADVQPVFAGLTARPCAHVVLSTAGLPAGQYRVWRLLTDDGVEHVELRNPWKGLNPPVYSGGTIAKIIENPIPHLVNDLDWNDDPHFAEVLGPYRSLIAVPLFNEGLPLNWSLILMREPDGFTANHLEESVTRATLIGSLLGSLHVSRRWRRRTRISKPNLIAWREFSAPFCRSRFRTFPAFV